MIFTLSDTDTHEIARTLVEIRDDGSQGTTSRVLTLIAVAKDTDNIRSVISASKDASREHPCRVIVLVTGDPDRNTRIDAEVRIGGDAGASEIIVIDLEGEVTRHLVHVVTPLLLPDTPIVVWWPYTAPVNPAEDPLGRIAQRRITDSQKDPLVDALYNRRNSYTDGDSDLAWARITPWRGVVASGLDQPPFEPVIEAKVYGVPVTRIAVDVPSVKKQASLNVTPVERVELVRPSGATVLEALDGQTIGVSVPNREPARVAVNLRTDADCLAEELRHLDPDHAYDEVLRGLNQVSYPVV